MSNEAGKSPSTGSADAAQLQRSIDSIQSQLTAMRNAQASQRRSMTLGVVGLLIIILAFGFGLYSVVRSKLSKQQLLDAAKPQVDVWIKKYQPMYIKMAQEMAPEIRTQAMARFDKIRPEVEKRVKAEAAKFPNQMQELLDKDLAACLQRVADRAGKEAKTQFPMVTDEKRQEALVEAVKGDILNRAQDMTDHINNLFTMEREKYRIALEKFPIDLYKDTPTQELEIRFVEQMLGLASYEASVAGTDKGSANPVVPATPVQ